MIVTVAPLTSAFVFALRTVPVTSAFFTTVIAGTVVFALNVNGPTVVVL